ncbi:uncharacterized protein LOC142996348 isoform X1 [Genypterus blacodes]|uniref:uncharacterized protein LOC142996348 isoform X1 n=1 Tax=Genypterus blacodes TaxID=154954 RepID=UPI003F777864
MNTNDPDYEHIYSIEAYDEPQDELLYFAPPANRSQGEAVPQKTDKSPPNKSVVVQRAAKVEAKKELRVPSLKPFKPRSVRSKRRVEGEEREAPADACLLPMEEGSCGRYTLRWYFNGRACRPFVYGGCEGNANRFLYQEDCEAVCLGESQGA